MQFARGRGRDGCIKTLEDAAVGHFSQLEPFPPVQERNSHNHNQKPWWESFKPSLVLAHDLSIPGSSLILSPLAPQT